MRLIKCLAAAAAISAANPALAHQRVSGHTMVASWYGGGERLSSHTANGERFRSGGFTAAHKSLRFGTQLRVTNPRTGRSVVVRINDRGPFVRGRDLDLSRGAARAIGMTGTSRLVVAFLR